MNRPIPIPIALMPRGLAIATYLSRSLIDAGAVEWLRSVRRLDPAP